MLNYFSNNADEFVMTHLHSHSPTDILLSYLQNVWVEAGSHP